MLHCKISWRGLKPRETGAALGFMGHALCARQCVVPEATKACMLHVYLTASDQPLLPTAQVAAMSLVRPLLKQSMLEVALYACSLVEKPVAAAWAEGAPAALRGQLANMPFHACSLAEELVASAGAEDAAASARAELEQAQWERQHVEQQLAAATEMLGEKDERLEELRNDLMDVKHLYKDQIEFMIEQLAFKAREHEQPGQQHSSSIAADLSAPAS